MTIKSMEFPKVASSRRVWFAHARMAAVLGSCPKSLESFRSGLRCYMKFAVKAYGCVADGFPPSVDGILAWSNIFRCVGTFTNYVAHVRCACCALNVQCPQPGDPAIARAKVTVVKRMVESDKPRMFIQRALVRRLLAVPYQSPDDLRFAMLWLAAYAFLLRVPSKALGMRRGGGDFTPSPTEQSVLFLDNDTGELCLKLHRRKNRQHGSLLKRVCCCSKSPDICPVHVLWEKFFKELRPGCAPWGNITSNQARSRLRDSLHELQVWGQCLNRACVAAYVAYQVPNAMSYGTHDFRRGHTKAHLSHVVHYLR